VAGAEALVAQALLARGERDAGLVLLRRAHATLQTQAGPEARATRRAAAALRAAEASATLPLP
jgi:cytidylate kinase